VPADTISVQTLLDHIHWLSAELKRRAAASSEQEKLLLATRGVLQTLATNGNSSVPAIAHTRNTTRQNIQIIANRLAELGLVEFIPNPRHKKSDLLRLTEKGATTLAPVVARQGEFIDGLAAHLRQPELEAAVLCLADLRTFLGSPAGSVREHSTGAATAKRPARALGSFRRETPNPLPIPLPPQSTPVAIPQSYPEEESLPVNLL
jgi:DNA-binding MarR family transcriptional regulator